MTDRSSSSSSRPARPTNRHAITAAILLQFVCLILFASEIVISVFGLSVINWQLHELIEIGAVLGLFIGTCVGVFALRHLLRRNQLVEDQLRAASGAFVDLMHDRFDQWDLTPAERDVALFSIKGVPPTDIATMRGVSEGTIKAQTNAIYRKAGVSGRPQLISLFVEELMNGPLDR